MFYQLIMSCDLKEKGSKKKKQQKNIELAFHRMNLFLLSRLWNTVG